MPGIHLNPIGRQQAALIGHRLVSLDALFSSPMERALETASIIGKTHNLEPIVSEAFTERDFAAWTGMAFQDLSADRMWANLDTDEADQTQIACESIFDVQRRAVVALQHLIRGEYSGKRIAIVSHSAVIRAVLAHAAGVQPCTYLQFITDPASVSEIQHTDLQGFRIARVNDCTHII